MTGQLQSVGGGGDALCKHCGSKAVGPCARCHEPVCGDCCVLTETSAKTWAICLACDRRGGRALGGAWVKVIAWVLAPIVVLALLLVLLHYLAG